MKVWSVLMQDEGPTFTQLKDQVKLSAPVLAEYLKRFEADGFVERVDRRYRLKKIFVPIKKLSDTEKAMRVLASSAPLVAMMIKQIKDKAKRASLLNQFLKLYLVQGSSLMVSLIVTHCLAEWRGNPQKLDVLLPLLNDQAKNWAVPYIQKVALALALNIDDVAKNEQALKDMLQGLTSEMDKSLKLMQAEVKP
jgi:DNA-binding HxlR family transcriptional regulator